LNLAQRGAVTEDNYLLVSIRSDGLASGPDDDDDD